jgi:hypothetical protein
VTRDQLEHAIRAACDIAEDNELFVFGSQALLGGYPDAPPSLRASIEVDVQPVNRPERVDAIDGALGELSQFHATFGFYVHGVAIESATLPRGWDGRTVPVAHPVRTRGNIGHCLEGHDLAASKLAAYREKDRAFVATLLAERMIASEVLVARVRDLPIGQEHAERLEEWVRLTVRDLSGRDPEAHR